MELLSLLLELGLGLVRPLVSPSPPLASHLGRCPQQLLCWQYRSARRLCRSLRTRRRLYILPTLARLHLGQFTQYGCTRYDKQQSRAGQLVLSPLAQLRTEWHTHARQRAARKRFARQNIHTEFYHAPQQFWKHKKQFQKYKEHPLHHAHNNHHTFYDHTLQHRQRRR